MHYRLGVIGDPIKHSLSPKIHNIFSKQTNIDIDYQAYHVLEDNLDSFIKDFFSNGGDGLNITLPHKINCLSSANEFSPIVKKIGAANTLIRNKVTNQILAESTDGVGLVNALLESNINPIKSDILIIGAGGAAQSVIRDLQNRHPRVIAITNRTKEKVEPLIKRFPSLNHDDLYPNTQVVDIETYLKDWEHQGFHIVINASSANEAIDFEWCESFPIRDMACFYDLSYSNMIGHPTPFIKWIFQKSKNKKIIRDGFSMLVHQAAHSFELWTGVAPQTKITKSDLLND
tara:strand:+ start:162 stop:1025 length:864 start_codon:yes stop_codon:yes gene_type:complete